MGGPVATILPLGCPWRPFGSLLELSWAPAALTGRSLGALWGSLWSFGSVLSLRCEASKVWVLDQLGTARAPLYSFWGVFCAREASLVPWVPLTPFGVSPGALWVRSLCFFRVFWRSLDVGPVSVLFAVGRDVRSVHACACFARVRQTKKESLFRRSWGTLAPIKESKRGREERERDPEWPWRR